MTFPLGTSLFEGDIGSGKSSILLALEFALFGLGSEKGASLLRAAEPRGSVNLVFQVGTKEYSVMRTLERKGRGVQQGEGHIRGPDGVIYLSPSELKEKVLEILGFNEPPDPKSQSWIYRYAFFTPQEEMKSVLFMRPDLRLQTLRKTLHIEDYKIARDNASSLASSIDKKASELRAHASDLEEKRQEFAYNVEEIARDRAALESLTKREKELNEHTKGLKNQISILRMQKEKLSKVEVEISELRRQISRIDKELEGAVEDARIASQKLTNLRPRIDELLKIERPTNQNEDTLGKKIAGLEKEHNKLLRTLNTIDAKIQDYKDIQKKGICPTCDREVNAKEFTKEIRGKENESKEANEEVKKCETAVRELEELRGAVWDYKQTLMTLSSLQEQALVYEENLEGAEERVRDMQVEREELKGRLDEALEKFGKLDNLLAKLEPMEDEKERIDHNLTRIGLEVAGLDSTIRSNERIKGALDREIKAKEESIRGSTLLDEHRIWLEDYFAPAVDNIERHVMASFQQEFNQYFQKWFGLLVEDATKDARVDEEFTPIVEQDGYEQEVYYLSGGEKTSVALAYRLALNTLVQKVSTFMKSNILILDEPTDGLSREQLAKMRDILSELQCSQVIMVSHEKELESFADQVFHVVKNGGVSTIMQYSPS